MTGDTSIKRIKMVLPVPVPAAALAMFESQFPDSLKRPDIAIEFAAPKNGAKILDSYYEMTLSDAFVLDLCSGAEDEGYAAVCLNSMSDSGVTALRSRLSIPVIGPCQASFLTACMLGKKFSVLTMWKQWFPLYEKAIRELGLDHRLASIRHINTRPDTSELLAGKEEIVFEALTQEGRKAIEEDGADVLILGSTTMHQSHAHLVSTLPVPVINPGHVALKQCEMLLDLGLSHSKMAYPSPETPNDGILASVPTAF